MKPALPSRSLSPVVHVLIVQVLLAMGIGCLPAAAQTTQPVGDPNATLKRIESAVGQLDLSDDQRGRVEKMFKQSSGDLANAAPDLQNASPEDKASKYREILGDLREQIAGVLTDDQKQQLRDKLQSMRNDAGNRSAEAGTSPAGLPTASPAESSAASPPTTAASTSQPATVAHAGGGIGAGRAGQGRGAQVLQRFKDALGQLNLSDDQKSKTDAVLDDLTTQMRQIRQGVRSGAVSRDDVREKMAGVLQETLPKLSEILTPDQRTKLRSILQEENGQRLRGNGAPSPTTPSTTHPTTAPSALPPGTVNAGDSAKLVAPAAVVLAPPDAGQPAPDFQLKQLNGESMSLADAKHHILVIVFASASAPAFRDHAAALNTLHEKYSARGVQFLVVYTKEQHPVGGWELQRNKDDNINVPLARTATDRQTAARQLHDSLHLAELVALDSMDDHVATAYGVNQTVPAFVIDRDGTIAFRQSWLEPDTLGHALDEALAAKD